MTTSCICDNRESKGLIRKFIKLENVDILNGAPWLNGGQSEKLLRNLTPGTEYTIQLQHNQNRIFSEYNDIKVTTSISYPTPAIHIAYLTDAKALFNWDDSNFQDGDFEYIFSWKKDGKV